MKLTGISYNPKTGVINRHGKPVTTVGDNGYLQVSVNNKTVRQHQVAWYLTYGYWPSRIDHINRDKTDNRLVNLRESTAKVNANNRSLNKNNSSGFRGISWKERDQVWEVKYQRKYIGQYKTLEEAVIARDSRLERPRA